jgi:hypothetical protein
MKTLENSYCKPTTEAEWDLLPNRDLWCRNEDAVFGAIDFRKQKVSGKTEIPVQHFIDLVSDTVNAKWRLLDYGFENMAFDYYDLILKKSEKKWIISARNGEVTLNGELTNVANFTDLLTLIRFLK